MKSDKDLVIEENEVRKVYKLAMDEGMMKELTKNLREVKRQRSQTKDDTVNPREEEQLAKATAEEIMSDIDYDSHKERNHKSFRNNKR